MKKTIVIVLLLVASTTLFAFNAQMSSFVNSLVVEAKKSNSSLRSFDKKRGEKIFTSKHIGKKGKKISCTSCHGTDLTKNGEDLRTGKVIKPLSPKANPDRLTKVKKVKKWLRRNFKDVYNREGTAQEKGDVLHYILSK